MSARERAEAALARSGLAIEGLADGSINDALLTTALAGPDGEAFAAALGILGDAGLGGRLARLEHTTDDRVARKRARRALHQLRERGVRTEAPAAPRAVRTMGPPLQGWISGFDGSGDRIMWLVREMPNGALVMVAGVVNEPAGLSDARLFETTPKQLRAFRRDITDRGMRLVPVAGTIVDALLVEAQARSGPVEDRHGDYSRLRARLTDAPPAEPAEPRSSHVTAADPTDTDDLVRRSADLLAHTELRWWPAHEQVEPFIAEIREADASPIVLTDAQQETRFREMVERAVRTLFSPTVMARRLEGTAYVFGETERREAAAQALAVADALRASPDRVTDIPLFAALVQQSLSAHLAVARAHEPASREPGLIVTPDEVRARTPPRPPHTRS